MKTIKITMQCLLLVLLLGCAKEEQLQSSNEYKGKWYGTIIYDINDTIVSYSIQRTISENVSVWRYKYELDHATNTIHETPTCQSKFYPTNNTWDILAIQIDSTECNGYKGYWVWTWTGIGTLIGDTLIEQGTFVNNWYTKDGRLGVHYEGNWLAKLTRKKN